MYQCQAEINTFSNVVQEILLLYRAYKFRGFWIIPQDIVIIIWKFYVCNCFFNVMPHPDKSSHGIYGNV